MTSPPAPRPTDPEWASRLEFMQRAVRHYLGPIRPQEDVEDCAQRALIDLLRYLRRAEAHNLEALMNQIARARATDLLRREIKRDRVTSPVDDQVATLGAPQPESDDEEMLQRCVFAICEWFTIHRPRCLEIWQRVRSGMDLKRIAEIEGVAHAAMRKRWSRCQQDLRSAMGGDAQLSILREWA